MKCLQEKNNCCKVLFEPINSFENIAGENLLDKFYSEQTATSFSTQVHFLQCVVDNMNIAENLEGVKIVERGIESNFHVFTSTLYNLGMLNKIEHVLLENFFHGIPQNLLQKPTFYLRSDNVEVLKNRIKMRHRHGETNISEKYLEFLNFAYDKFYLGFFKPFKGKVFVLDSNDSVEVNVEKIVNIVSSEIKT